MNKTEVVCIKGRRGDPSIADVIYVGRPVYSGGWNLAGHPLANPFKVSQFTTQAQAVMKYDRWLDTQTELLDQWLPRLKGKRLGCWCVQGDPCHARILAFRADAYVTKSFKILFTGSRDLKDRRLVHTVLDRTVAQVPEEQTVILMEGGARGGDRLANEWADARRPRIRPRPYPADWNRFGNRAGIIRNEEMVDRKPDVCLAIIQACVSPECDVPEPHGSHGATHCAEYAKSEGIETFKFDLWKRE